VAASYATEGSNMKMLEQWNNLYGEGGSRKKEEQLNYATVLYGHMINIHFNQGFNH
jgi:hypothetical protein